jgi:DNA-binding XRE family transcriptional regulator
VPLLLADDQRKALREDCLNVLHGVLGDLAKPERLRDPAFTAAEGEIFRRLMEALDYEEITVPDEEMRARIARLSESYDKMESAEEVIATHAAHHALLRVLDGTEEVEEALRSPGPGWIAGDDADCRREVLSLLLDEAPALVDFDDVGCGPGGRLRGPEGKEHPQGRDPSPGLGGPGPQAGWGTRADALGPPDGRARFRDRLMDEFDKRVAVQFGRRLRRRRYFLDLSQSALADRAGLHYTQISLYERGEVMPLTSTLVKLAASLGVSTDQLVAGVTWEVLGPPLGDSGDEGADE